MNLQRWHKAALIALAGLFVFYMASLGFPAEYQVCHPDDYTHAKTCADHHFGPGVIAAVIAWADIHSGLVTAFATVGIGLFTWTLWNTSREQGRLTEIAIEDARISSQRELRAYIEAVPEKMALRTDDRTVVGVVRIKNTGKTPAFKVRVVSDFKVWPVPLDQPFRFQGDIATSSKPIPTYVVYPDGEHINAPVYQLTADDLMTLGKDNFGLYLFGRIAYEDAFGNPQWADFCSYLDQRMFAEWLVRAKQSEGRVAVMAGFKFSHLNNDASRF